MRWAAIEGFPDYEVSSTGIVRRVVSSNTSRAGRCLKPWRESNGYWRVSLRCDGKTTKFWLHRLVCWAFCGPPPTAAHEAAHDDGDKSNNCLSNISWKTPKENAADMLRHGVRLRGASHPGAKLSEEEARTIAFGHHRYGYAQGMADRLGVKRQLIYDVRARRLWKHLEG